jgi:hypothetical protein
MRLIIGETVSIDMFDPTIFISPRSTEVVNMNEEGPVKLFLEGGLHYFIGWVGSDRLRYPHAPPCKRK